MRWRVCKVSKSVKGGRAAFRDEVAEKIVSHGTWDPSRVTPPHLAGFRGEEKLARSRD